MESTFKIWKTSRKLYLDFFDNYTLEQLNKTPEGFNNNLIWNIGHIIVAQQALIYKTSGLKGHISESLFESYKPGTKPTDLTTQTEADELKALLFNLVDLTIADFEAGEFKVFNERMTGTGFHLATLTDAFEFNNYHEGLHLGYMMGGIRKFI